MENNNIARTGGPAEEGAGMRRLDPATGSAADSSPTSATSRRSMKPARGRAAQRSVRALAPAMVLGLTATACGGSIGGGDNGDGAEGADETLTIGVIAPVTGNASLEGNALRNGFELGVEALNENGGVLGNDVEIVFMDDQGDASVSTQAAQRLIQQDEVDYLFGTIAGDTSEAAAGVAEAEGVPFSTAMIGSIPHCSPHFWPFGATELMVTRDAVPYMMEEYGDSVALVGNDYLFPRQYHEVARDLIEDAGGTVAVEEYSTLGTSDWQPVINRIDGADPDWILTAVVGGDAISFTQQADQFGILDDVGITGVSLQQEFYSGTADIIEGTVTAQPYSDQLPGEANEAFVEEFREAYDFEDPIPVVAAVSYHAALYIGEAVNSAGSTDADSISAQMPEVELDGLVGRSSFNPDNHTFSTQMHLFEIGPDGVYEPIEDLGIVEDDMERDCS